MMTTTRMESAPDVEVPEKPKRRRFTAEYKQRIVQAAGRCTRSGEVGALLRREGIYSSHLATWRKRSDTGTLKALSPKKRGPKKKRDPRDAEVAKLQRENARLKKQLEHHTIALEAQKNRRREPHLLQEKLQAAMLKTSRGEAVNFLERSSP